MKTYKKLKSGSNLGSMFGGYATTALSQAPNFINNPNAPKTSTAQDLGRQVGNQALNKVNPLLGTAAQLGQQFADKLGNQECDPVTGECVDTSSNAAQLGKQALDPIGSAIGTGEDLLSGRFEKVLSKTPIGMLTGIKDTEGQKKLEEMQFRAKKRKENEYTVAQNKVNAQNLVQQQNKYKTMGDNFGYAKEGGLLPVIKFQQGTTERGLQVTEKRETSIPWELSQQQKLASDLARQLFTTHGGNLVKVKEAIEELKQNNQLPEGVESISVQPMGVQHRVMFHPDEDYQTSLSKVREGLADDEINVVAGVKLRGQNNPFINNYPIIVGKAKSQGKQAGVTYGKVTEDERVAMERKKNPEDVYNNSKSQIGNLLNTHFESLPEYLKQNYIQKIPNLVPIRYRPVASNKKGGMLSLVKYQDGGINEDEKSKFTEEYKKLGYQAQQLYKKGKFKEALELGLQQVKLAEMSDPEAKLLEYTVAETPSNPDSPSGISHFYFNDYKPSVPKEKRVVYEKNPEGTSYDMFDEVIDDKGKTTKIKKGTTNTSKPNTPFKKLVGFKNGGYLTYQNGELLKALKGKYNSKKTYLEDEIELQRPTNTKKYINDELDFNQTMNSLGKYITGKEEMLPEEFSETMINKYPELVDKLDKGNFEDRDVNLLKKKYDSFYKIKPKLKLAVYNGKRIID